jgi:hypothetical protein
MPTILIIGPYRFFFVSLDAGEPPHIHIQRERMVAKFWLILYCWNVRADSSQRN